MLKLCINLIKKNLVSKRAFRKRLRVENFIVLTSLLTYFSD